LLAIGTAAYDRARTCIILLVLVHHSILPYTHDGRSNHESFLGFDAVAAFNDSFMAAMFLLSGLFVWPSLRHKGIAGFLRDRWWRLGFPFAIAALILMPIAYYADEIRRHHRGFAAYGGRRSPSAPGIADRPGSSGRCSYSMCWRRSCTALRQSLSKPSASCRSEA
jgi:Acyltransferase family